MGKLKIDVVGVAANTIAAIRSALPDWEVCEFALSGDDCPLDFESQAPNLIVLQAQPERSRTMSLCKRVKSHAGGREVPVIVVVKMGQVTHVADIIAHGANTCLIGPCRPKSLP